MHGDNPLCCYHYSLVHGPCDCSDDDYGDALAEGAMGSYNGRTTIDSPEPNALTVKEAQTLLSAINTAHRNGLDVSGMRGWLSSHGHATALDASGLFVLTPPRCEYCDGTGLIPNG